MGQTQIPINSGTGPNVAVDTCGTGNVQIVKVMQAADGNTASLATTLAISGSMSVINTPVITATISNNPLVVTAANVTIASITTGTVSVVGTPAVTAANVTIASITTGTVSVVGTPAVTAANVTIASITTGTVSVVGTPAVTAANVTIASITTGTVSVVGTPAVTAANVTIASITTGTMTVLGNFLYTNAGTALGTTGQGILVIGLQSGATTARGLAISVTGGLHIASMPAVGGGQQYSVANTDMGATGTGTLFLGIQTGLTTARAMALSVTGGLHIASMPAVGGGQQYSVANTDMGATGTGTIFLGIQTGLTTARAMALSVTGGLHIASMPAVGGGQQYSIPNTDMGATGTGTLFLGMQTGATTGRGIAVTTTGAIVISFVTTQAITAANITIASVTTGTMNVINVLSASGVTIASMTTGTVNVVNVLSASGVTIASVATGTADVHVSNRYVVDTTSMAATATGFVMLGMQSGATTARGVALTTTGAAHVSVIGTPTVTATVSNTLTITGTVGMITTGTVNVVNVLSASGVTIASMTTGTVNVVNTVAISGTVSASLLATTAGVGAFVMTAHASRWDALVVSTTSGGGHAILKTSGAHTLYITDLMVSVDVPMVVQFYSSSAAQSPKSVVYLATKGGFAFSLKTPIVLTSAQSLVFIGNLSGSCAALACGYTVT